MATFATSKRFEIVRCLGEGGMGIVYEAVDRERQTRVALKTLRHVTPESLARLKREFRAMQDVHHGNLVTLGDLVSEGDQWCFTMELVEGPDLFEYVQTRGLVREDAPPPSRSSEGTIALAATLPFMRAVGYAFDEDRVRGAFRQLADALCALHAAGLVHRDVKPSNVRVTPDGRVVLLDFGLVTSVTGDPISVLQIVGTPDYMAPEQATSDRAGPEADWYAFGVMLFQALTGKVPFQGAPLQVMLRKQREEPAAPSTFASGVPADLDALCVQLLRFAGHARPGGAAVLRVLGAGTGLAGPSRSQTQAAPFVGRSAELEVLAGALEGARGDTPVAVIVEGESGVGKSALVRRFLDMVTLQDPDTIVLSGRCYERESVPYKAFDGVIDSLAQWLGRMRVEDARGIVPTRPVPLVKVFPVLKRVSAIAELARGPQPVLDPHDLRNLAFAGLRDLIVRLGDRQMLVIVIDDVQWADDDSFVLLSHLLRPPEPPRLLLVMTSRMSAVETTRSQEPAGPSLVQALDAAQTKVTTLRLGRLPEAEAQELAARLLERVGVRDPEVAEWSARQAHGHPLFIDLMTRAGTDGSGHGRGNLKLEDALWQMISALDGSARSILEVLALASAPLPQQVVARAAEVDGEAFAKGVALLRVAHLAQATGIRGSDRLEPYHDRVRASVLAHMDDALRTERHRSIAIALETSGSADPEALVVHWRGAGDSDQTARYAILAGDRATDALAFDWAARWYELSLASRVPSSADDHRALLIKIGEARVNAGRGKTAAEAFRSAAKGASAAQALDLRRRAAEQLLRSGHFDDGLIEARDVLAAVGERFPGSPLTTLVLILLWRTVLWFRGLRFRRRDATEVAPTELLRVDICYSLAFALASTDNIYGSLFNVRTLLLALRAGEPERIAKALGTEVVFSGTRGASAWKQTQAVMDRGLRLAKEANSSDATAFVTGCGGVAAYMNGHFRMALALCDEGVSRLRETGATAWERATGRLFSLNALSFLGDFKELSLRRGVQLADARARGDVYAEVALCTGYPNLSRLAADDVVRARDDVTSAMQRWSKRGFHVEHFYELLALVHIDLYEGRFAEARARIAVAERPMRWSLVMRIQSVRIRFFDLRARCFSGAIAGETDDATRLRSVLADARRVEREQTHWSTPLAVLLRAGVAAQQRQDAKAAAYLRTAVAGFDGADMHVHAAAATRALGALLGGDGGRGHVEQADTWMASHSIQNPQRMAALLAPGLDPSARLPHE